MQSRPCMAQVVKRNKGEMPLGVSGLTDTQPAETLFSCLLNWTRVGPQHHKIMVLATRCQNLKNCPVSNTKFLILICINQWNVQDSLSKFQKVLC